MSKSEKSQDTNDLDLSLAARGVWLVKVPKYLSEKWKHCSESGEVGKLRISKPRIAGGKPEVIFSLDSKLAATASADKTQVPKDHKFVLTGLGKQSLSVLTSEPSGKESTDPSSSNESLAVEGKVIQRAECRPVADANYMALKRTNFEMSNSPARQVVQLQKAVVNYKPKTSHAATLDNEGKRKDEGKRMRMDKDKVMDMLFSAFEKHQYYNLKDLVKLTEQPVTYLKEILREICTYNMKAPHKNMWELKSEFRHYKEGAGTSSGS